MKPERQFSANEGDYSIGLAGPDAIEADIDTLARMFDPLTTHSDGTPGGIGTDNIQTGAITDDVIGDRTINDSIVDAYSNTGRIGKLFSLIAKAIKGLKGTTNWFDSPSDTINGIHTRVSSNAAAISNHKTSADHDSRYYTETEIDSKISVLATKEENNLKANKIDVYTKNELAPFINGGETVIRREVFTIINNDNLDGTFTYVDVFGTEHIGMLGDNGEQIFTLFQGYYERGTERLEVIINDTLHRTATSGGVLEISETEIALTSPEQNGAEITVKYYERIGIGGIANISYGNTTPTKASMWFKVVG